MRQRACRPLRSILACGCVCMGSMYVLSLSFLQVPPVSKPMSRLRPSRLERGLVSAAAAAAGGHVIEKPLDAIDMQLRRLGLEGNGAKTGQDRQLLRLVRKLAGSVRRTVFSPSSEENFRFYRLDLSSSEESKSNDEDERLASLIVTETRKQQLPVWVFFAQELRFAVVGFTMLIRAFA